MVECENSVHKHQKEGQELLPTKSGHTRVILLGVRARQTALADFLYFLGFSWIQRRIRASLITLIFAKSTLLEQYKNQVCVEIIDEITPNLFWSKVFYI